MKPIVAKVQESQLRKDHPVFRPGDTIRVNVRLKEGEGDKERIQPFEGVVMARRGELLGESFTVRRAKLNYLRARKGKAARIKRAESAVVAAPAASSSNE